MINGAKRPVIYAGNGVLSSPEGPKLLKQLSDLGNIPVTTTLQGLGAYDERSDKSLHMLGMHGSAYANFAMQEADVLIALGARFDDRVTGKVDSEFLFIYSSGTALTRLRPSFRPSCPCCRFEWNRRYHPL